MAPEAGNIQQRIATLDAQLINNDSQYNALYKQVKTSAASQDLLNTLKQFQLSLSKEN